MAKMYQWIEMYLPTKRRIIQLYSALLYNAHIKGFIKGEIYTGQMKILCVPGLNCYSCPGAVGACPLGALQNAVASSGNRLPFYVIGILMLYGLMLGRTICGFLCPFGLIQELLHRIPTPKLQKSRFTRLLSYLKYVILAVMVVGIPIWYSFQHLPVPAFCKYICPAGTVEGAVGLMAHPQNEGMFSMLGPLFTNKFVMLIVTLGACVFIYRAFCRFLCPLGAIYGMFSKLALIGVKLDVPKCIHCDKCVRKCQMDIKHVGDHECIHCTECIDVCPTGAISFKAGRITLQGPQFKNTEPKKGRRTATWTAAIILLAGVIAFVNLERANGTDDKLQADASRVNSESKTEMHDIPPELIGAEVGLYAPDFVASMYGKEMPFVLSAHRGKKVIVNFWATWCTPCCKELPYFDEIHRKYGDRVTVVAIHSDLITDDVEAYLSHYDYQMRFAQDETGEIIRQFGGSTMLPHTIIIDEQGVITYNAAGSLTLEKLEALLGFAK